MSALFLQGNARDVLKGLPADYFHCAMTSPPYFGLRRYDSGEEIWGGEESCSHEWVDIVKRDARGVEGTGLNGRDPYKSGEARVDKRYGFCSKCGAWRGQLGGEPTPELYIQHLTEICREVRRVLRPDGVFWLNVGDSWAGSGKGQMGDGSAWAATHDCKQSTVTGSIVGGLAKGYSGNGIKPLDMVLIPEQIALALRADGWYLRSILIWAKGVSLSDEFNGNPMPESVNGWRWERHKVKVAQSKHEMDLQEHASGDGIGRTTAGLNVRKERGAVDGWQDCSGCPKCEKHNGYVLRKGSWRPTDSYEQILMLTKTGSYFCDREAVLEPIAPSTIGRCKVSFGGEKGRNYNPDQSDPNFRNGSEQWGREYDYTKSNGNGGRNLRSVLDVPIDLNDAVMRIPTAGWKGAHFAVFPPRLVLPLIKSATSEKGCCPACGSPWARVIHKTEVPHDGSTDCKNLDEQGSTRRLALMHQAARERGGEYANQSSTIGWLPTCSCGNQEVEPCRVLDPFSGAGTTALVCEHLGLDSIGIDTSAEYIELAEARIVEDEQKRIDEQIRLIRKEAKLASKAG